MRGKILAYKVIGLVSALCVFLGEFPYSLIPFAVFLYVALPPRRNEFHRKRTAFRRAMAALPSAPYTDGAAFSGVGGGFGCFSD